MSIINMVIISPSIDSISRLSDVDEKARKVLLKNFKEKDNNVTVTSISYEDVNTINIGKYDITLYNISVISKGYFIDSSHDLTNEFGTVIPNTAPKYITVGSLMEKKTSSIDVYAGIRIQDLVKLKKIVEVNSLMRYSDEKYYLITADDFVTLAESFFKEATDESVKLVDSLRGCVLVVANGDVINFDSKRFVIYRDIPSRYYIAKK